MTKKAFFFRYAKGHIGKLVLLMSLTLGATATALATPQLIRKFLDDAQAKASYSHLIFTALVFMALALLEQALGLVRFYIGELIAWKATNHLREDLARHCLRLDMNFHKTHKPGELLERVDNDVNETRGFFSSLFTDIAATIPLFIGVITFLWIEDWRLGAGAFLLTLVAALIFPRINKARIPLFTQVREVHAQLSGDLQEWIQGREDIQASSSVNVMMNRLQQRYGQRYKASLKLLPTNTLANSMPILIIGLSYALAYTMSSGVFGAAMPVSGLAMVLLYLDKLQQPIYTFQWSLDSLATAKASLGRIAEFLDEKSSLKNGENTLERKEGLHLRIEDVSFGYDETDVLKNISLELKPGERLGLLGRTGSGKTTLTRLVMHLYEPRSGRILFGSGVTFYEPGELLPGCLDGMAAMVTQEVELFQASVRDNLTLFNHGISDEAVMAALESVSMTDWLERQPKGLDTRLNGASGLSAGEAQLLSIARIFLRNPALVILDEASSRLDPATERKMEHAVASLLKNRTAIIIAHRLDTVQKADRIVILEQGRIVEEGLRVDLIQDPESRFSGLLRTGMEAVLA